MNLHRNTQRRFYDETFTYMVTVNVAQKIPYFREEIFCELWIEELRLCKELKKFELYGFCLNYDHFHMLVKPGEEFDISQIMHSLKRNFSRDINRILFGFENMRKTVGAVPQPRRREINGEDVDLRLQERREEFCRKYGGQHSFPKFQWQKSFHDHVIRGDRDFDNQSNYVIYNFLKHGLSEHWKYTSLNFPELLDMP